ncbi:VOC family protein [Hymenobacter agri]
MQTPTPQVLKGKVLRPAIIELGVADAAQLAKTKAFYEALLGDTTYPYRLLTNMALLCVATEDGSTHTIIYWEVPGASAELKATYDDLIKHHGCSGVKPPHKPPKSLAKDEMEIATLADAAGNVLGLVINPPYPVVR